MYGKNLTLARASYFGLRTSDYSAADSRVRGWEVGTYVLLVERGDVFRIISSTVTYYDIEIVERPRHVCRLERA